MNALKRRYRQVSGHDSRTRNREYLIRRIPGCCWQALGGLSARAVGLVDGFEFKGERYGSLSAIAKAVTGSHVNGSRFFTRVKLAAC